MTDRFELETNCLSELSEHTTHSKNRAKRHKRQWTLMFYFATDNPLAPGVVSQLKALKYAGYHWQANVLAYFDPQSVGTPTHVFDINILEKLGNPTGHHVGWEANDPYVRDSLLDKLWGDEKDRKKRLIREMIGAHLVKPGTIYDPPEPPDLRGPVRPGADYLEGSNPKRSLDRFLTFCQYYYPAKNYILFILGHGLVVANDVFLFDEHAEKHSLGLVDLGKVLTRFKQKVEAEKSQFQMVSFHSCSLSAAEVAYELEGTANYMLASQGPTFVGSWPYKQILVGIFNDLRRRRTNADAIKKRLRKIFYYCLYNNSDFLLAGYSFDLCLCNLNKVSELKAPMRELSEVLTVSLNDPLLKDFILLSHWRSQSHWEENYTDIYDFCFCLRRRLLDFRETEHATRPMMDSLDKACAVVINVLEKEELSAHDRLIARAGFAGPRYQYSHGLSVYFPWTEPVSDLPIMEQYNRYKFANDNSWLNFLRRYFEKTMRKPRNEEMDLQPESTPAQELLEDIATLVYYSEGNRSGGYSLSGGKVGPDDPTGDDCSCPTIKNYPHDTRALRDRRKEVDTKSGVVLSEQFFKKY